MNGNRVPGVHDHDIEPRQPGIFVKRDVREAEPLETGTTGPYWLLSSVLPIMKLTATGLSMNGSRKITRKNLRPRTCWFEQKRQPVGDDVLDQDGGRRRYAMLRMASQ